jgi:GDP-4-dehydro-6-deoxy-D-mannose reductase
VARPLWRHLISESNEPENEMRRVLITGGTGFVGAHLVRFLKPAASIVVLASTAGIESREDGVAYYDVDIRSVDQLRAIVREVSPIEVYHLAAMSSVASSWSNPRLTFEVNVIGTYNLLEATMSLASPPRILNISTAQVYAASSMPLGESNPTNPSNPYAATKAMAELVTVQYRKSEKGGVITARSFNHTGPGQSTDFVLPSIAKQFAEIEIGLRPPELHVGNLDVSRDFTDVRDVVHAYSGLMSGGKPGQIYNVCSGTAVRVDEVISEFESLCNTKVKIHIDASRLRASEATRVVGDRTKIENEIGWKPQTPLRATIKDLLTYWRQEIAKGQLSPRITSHVV